MGYAPDYLVRRRRASERARRRRRRLIAAVPAALVIAAAAVVVLTGHPPSEKTALATPRSSPPPVVAAARGHEEAAATRTEFADVRRLARYGLPLFCGGRARRVVALTFDDGPGPYTTLALRKLREFHARATFFLVGKSIAAYPRVAARERPFAAVGDHTMTHPFLPALAHTAMVWQIAAAKSLIERAAGQAVALFRPPYEGRTPAVDREARALGLLEVLWSVDSADSLGANYAGIEHNVITGVRPGSIVLMHENRGQTIRGLPAIFAALARDHLKPVTIPELVAEDPPSSSQLREGWRGCGKRPARARD